MPGIFHAIFGTIIGLIIWKMTEAKDGTKRFSLAIVFIFIFNNYAGPDFAAVLWGIGSAVHSDVLVSLGDGVHSYFGWILWAIPWSIMWYLILLGFQKARAKNAGHAGNDELFLRDPRHSWADVFLAVLAGGFCHHFIDAISHFKTVGPRNYVRGHFTLIAEENGSMMIAQVCLAAITAGIAIAWMFVTAKKHGRDFAHEFKGYLDRKYIKAVVFAAIAIGNVLVMYAIMASRNVIEMDNNNIEFSVGNALYATSVYDSGRATWWLVIGAGMFIVLFAILYAKNIIFTIKHCRLRADVLSMFLFLAFIITGYILAPVIGNISGDEADFGALIFTWSTIGTSFVALLAARSFPEKPLETRKEAIVS